MRNRNDFWLVFGSIAVICHVPITVLTRGQADDTFLIMGTIWISLSVVLNRIDESKRF